MRYSVKLHAGLGPVDIGSDQQSFKVMAKSGGFTSVVLLTVKEYDSAAENTFLFYRNFMLVVGACR